MLLLNIQISYTLAPSVRHIRGNKNNGQMYLRVFSSLVHLLLNCIKSCNWALKPILFILYSRGPPFHLYNGMARVILANPTAAAGDNITFQFTCPFNWRIIGVRGVSNLIRLQHVSDSISLGNVLLPCNRERAIKRTSETVELHSLEPNLIYRRELVFGRISGNVQLMYIWLAELSRN